MICVKDLCFSYDNTELVLDNISFTVNDGESVALIGSNGAGKSTLMFNILGVLMPSSGEITAYNLKLEDKNIQEIRKNIGLVWQNPDDQLFMNSVRDDVGFGPRNYGHNEEKVNEIIDRVMEELNITHLSSRSSQRLSFGEKRKVAIATILSMEPKALLLDEPSSFLDPRARRNIIELLKKLPQTKIIATHDLDLAENICDRVIILKSGKIVVDGSAKDILNNKDLLYSSGL